MTLEALETVELRFHGRGGQGVVTASKLLAEAAMKAGKYFQALPEYGAERMGAPIRAFTRISSAPILLHCQITNPNIVVVVDSALLDVIDVTEGIIDGGILVVNTMLSPDEVKDKLDYRRGRVSTVDATGIALDVMGRNFPNVPILGALLKVYEIVNKDVLHKMIEYKLGLTMKASVVEANVKSFERAYAEAQVS